MAYQSRKFPVVYKVVNIFLTMVKAQHFFDYEIRPQIGDAGSYYYHSHVGLQATTAAGPLIVEEVDGIRPYEYDEERLMFFSELYNHTDKETMEGLTAPLAKYLW